MKKRKNKSLSTFIVLCVMLVMICFVTISGTYAKYTSTISGSDSARVAKWKWQINGTDVDLGQATYTLDLFSTIKDTDDTDEANVSTTEKIIAPGTKGSFKVTLKNASEVDAKYSVDFNIENADNINLEFSTDGTNYSKTLTGLDAKDIAMNGTDEFTIYWQWAYEAGKDAEDTTLGIAGTAKPKVTANLTLTQVD